MDTIEVVLSKHGFFGQTKQLTPAMEEYARQEAIRFAEWINGEMYECMLHSDEGAKFWHDWEGKGVYSTEELYNLYLNQRKPS